ncbi:MAG: hypothetical protein N2690_11485, partial [Rhodocyclaceae bacterium]|nr:hypothetical protein [Rhodocyclaceae bacterium]
SGKGGMKIEGAWARDERARGGELLIGFAPLEHLEISLAASRSRDRAEDPATRLGGSAIGLKWVPIQNETGWSFGASLILDRVRVDERANDARWVATGHALTGLASYRFPDGQKVHANLGVLRTRAPGERDTLGSWGLGYEYPLGEKLQLTAEIFGAEKSRPDKALGLRYAVAEGLKLSGAIGRGNDRSFGQIGFAWEF